MKRVFFVITFLLLSQLTLGQSKIGYIDSETIIKTLPDAQDVQKQLDKIIKDWQDELTKLEKELKDGKADFEKRKLIMSDQKRMEREKELLIMEGKVNDFKQKKYGTEGELYKKQEELMKPIHNKIFTVVKEIAEKDSYDYIFDRSGDMIFLFAKDKYDLTNLVLEKLK